MVKNENFKKALYDEPVNAIQTIHTSDLFKKLTTIQKFKDIEKKLPNLHKYITTTEFNKLTSKAKASKSDIADFVKRTYFDEKLMNIKFQIKQNMQRLKIN